MLPFFHNEYLCLLRHKNNIIIKNTNRKTDFFKLRTCKKNRLFQFHH